MHPIPAQDPAPQTAPPLPIPPKSHKRKASADWDLQNSAYYKIRSIVHDLRPHFLEVLRAPDFRNCKAASEIRTQLKIVADLYDKMIAVLEPVGTCTNGPGTMNAEARKEIPGKSTEETPPHRADKKTGDGLALGTYMVGGSVFGWNYITFSSSKPVYYGVTKEIYRISHPKAEAVNMPPPSADISVEAAASTGESEKQKKSD